MKEHSEVVNRLSTAKTESSRAVMTRSSTGNNGKSRSRENGFIRGDRISHSSMTPLDSLYKSSYPRYPTFPSIYQTKYDHDFQYVPWPAIICKREYTPPPDYSKFKVGKSSYTEEFQPREPMKNTIIAPLSRYRVNKPHPRIHNVQNYPDANRWIWSAPENPLQMERTSTTAERVRKWQRNLEPQFHRWNSR